MSLRRFVAVILATLPAVAFPVHPSGAGVDLRDSQSQRQRFYANPDGVVGRYIVRLADSAAGRRGRFSMAPQAAEAVALAHGVARVRQVYTHALSGFSAEMSEDVARRVSQDSRVEYVVQTGRARLTSATQNNPPWGLDRIDQETGTDNTYSYDNDGQGVTVYVVDTGIRISHQEFDGRASLGPAFVSAYPYATSADCDGHGTHVAGTIGGVVSGVAKGVDLVAVRVIDCNTELADDDDIIAAVDWITEYHSAPAVANASLWTYPNQALDEAIQNSVSAGVTWVVAAGNFKADAGNYSPSRVSEAIVVGATDSSDYRWVETVFGSNFGGSVDLFAPGVGVTSAKFTNDYDFEPRTGTSMAAPHVAGIAARYLGLFPNASSADVEGAIVDEASDIAIGNAGSGSPDLLANSEFLDEDPEPPSSPSCGSNDCLFADEGLYSGWYLESANMQYLLSYQGDGNLVLYDSSWNSLWASNTDNTDPGIAVMQGDGNFVVYDDQWFPHYASDTAGNNGAWIIVQNDGNIVIYEAGNGPPIKSIRYD